MIGQLTPNFSVFELTRSDYALRHGIDNTPSPKVLANLQRTAEMLERIRAFLGVPLQITSGYRCAELNAAVGGVPAKFDADGNVIAGSYHLFGLAADFCAPQFGTPYDVAKALEQHLFELRIDKLILEYMRWGHAQIEVEGMPPRCQAFTISDKLTGYKPGIVA